MLIGFLFGIIFSYYSFRLFNFLKKQATIEAHNKVYKTILANLNNKLVNFNSRINNTVEMSTSIPFEGDITLMYFFDKKEVAIFRGKDCLYTSIYCDKKILEDIVRSIWVNFSNQINSGVVINGNFLDAGTIYKNVNAINGPKIKKKKIFKIDDILDKINEVGYENLSNEEKEFLKNIK